MNLNVGLLNESFPPTIDGVSNCIFNYAENIHKGLGRAFVITPKYPGVKDEYDFPVHRYSSLNIGKKVGYRVGDPYSILTINKLVNENFDILHAHSPFASLVLANQIKKRHKVPIVYTYHTKFEIDIAKRTHKFIQGIVKKALLSNIKTADEVWVVSEGAAESLRAIGYTGSYQVMENGTDFTKGTASEKDISEINRMYALDDRPLLLFVGRMMWYKNIKLIIDSLSVLKQKSISFRMMFVGEGSDRPAIEKYTKKMGFTDEIIFTGAIYDREKVKAFFSRANLFLFPSTYDTSGLVVKEAASCYLPTLLISGSCAAEGVEHDFSGYLCEENVESTVSAIINALSDLNKLKQTGINASEHIYLSWEDAVNKAYKRYEEILKG